MLGNCPVMAFVATRDGARARTFYEEMLGLRFVSDDPSAIVFDIGGTMLRVQKVEKLAPAQHTALGWKVPSIGAAIAGLVRKGVVFERYGFFEQDELGVWTSPSGAKVAWFKDPDGNTLSLTQF